MRPAAGYRSQSTATRSGLPRERDKPWEATRLGPAGGGVGVVEVGVPAPVVVGEGVVEDPGADLE